MSYNEPGASSAGKDDGGDDQEGLHQEEGDEGEME